MHRGVARENLVTVALTEDEQITLGMPEDSGDLTNERIPILEYAVEMSPTNFTVPGDRCDN